jgi:hypothetical protein
VYFLIRTFSPLLIETPQDENVGENEGVAPRILILDDRVEPLVSNGQQAGYNPQLFWAPSTVACLYILETKTHVRLLST